jgi:hypothetical protein
MFNSAIGAAQAILFMLETSKRGDASSYLSRASIESRDLFRDVDSTKPPQLFAALGNCHFIRSVALETLRLTAHTIGAVRKVVPSDGWTFSTTDESAECRKTCYTIPAGAYVGASHIVPNTADE